VVAKGVLVQLDVINTRSCVHKKLEFEQVCLPLTEHNGAIAAVQRAHLAQVCKHEKQTLNECIGDDTKAAARQSQNCIKKIKWPKTIFNMAD